MSVIAPLNYKKITVNHAPPYVGERGNHLCLAQKHTKNTLCTRSMAFARPSYTMRHSTHGVTGADGGKKKYPLHRSIQGAYAQRPDATACVSLEDWNGKVGRWVRRGAKGIALLDDSRAKMKLKYVFDVSDTRLMQGGWTPVLWKMEQRHEAEVLSCLSDTYGLKGKEAAGIGSALMEVSSRIAEENLKEAMRGLDYEVEGRLENAILSCTHTMAGMVSAETARKKKELSQTVSIEEEIRKLEAEKKRFSSRKLRLYEDYRSGNITKEKYRKSMKPPPAVLWK